MYFQGLVSWLSGIEGFPDIYTWVGGFVILAGIGIITYSEHLAHSSTNSTDSTITNEDNIELQSSKTNDDSIKKLVHLDTDSYDTSSLTSSDNDV